MFLVGKASMRRMEEGREEEEGLKDGKRKMDTQQLPHSSWEDPSQSPKAAVISPQEVPIANAQNRNRAVPPTNPTEGFTPGQQGHAASHNAAALHTMKVPKERGQNTSGSTGLAFGSV